jgi:3'-phosphoadenosine 5'-phosphosulfate sulfotransferase (PAPS reductase)/FAD synthetase
MRVRRWRSMETSNGTVRHILLLSGGKDSTALAIYMRDRHPEIDLEYVFCDTHKELPETYEYLTRIEAYLGKPITRLSSELGERGFDHWLKMYGGFLPAANMRWCTRKLKIEPFEDYVGDDPVHLYIAIRADEHREGFISTKPNITPVYPFKEAGITKDDVYRLLRESGVDLPKYYSWRTRSGCYFCFFQRKQEWVGLLEQHPDLYELAKGYEKPESGYTWQPRESLEALSRPERVAQIRAQARARDERIAANRRPRTLAEAFGMGDGEPDDDDGCLICHL